MSVTRASKSSSRKGRAKERRKAIQRGMKEKKKARKAMGPEELARFEKRKAVVAAVQRGEAVSVVARVYGVSQRTVFRWLATVADRGMNGLSDAERSGRPSKLSPETMSWLYEAITGGNPKQYYLAFALWSLALIRTLLIDYKGIKLNKSTISRLMKKMGLSPQVPLYKSYRQNQGKVKYYLKTRYPKVVQWAQENGATIFFCDESRVRVDGHRGTTWAPIGETPVVLDSGDRFGVNMISAVSAQGQMFFECFEEKMDSQRFIEFLRKLRKCAGKPIAVVVDGGSYHKSKAVNDFIKEDGEKLGIKLVLLPPYSPELNPDEQVWNQAKNILGRMGTTTKKELLNNVNKVLRKIKSSVALIKSFFRLPDTMYAGT
jgi:transposase